MKHIMLCLMLGLILTSCSDKGEIQSQRRWIKHTVAIVAPVEDAITKVRLERTATWFLENFRQAQLHNSTAIDLHLEWYDESSEDLVKLSRELSGREDVLAVIGPFGNEDLAALAPACQRTGKPLIAPTATSEDIIRRYAVTTSGMRINRDPFLWSLTESDVSFTGLVMSRYASLSKYYGEILDSPRAAFFSPEDAYGMTFNYWAPFYSLQVDIDLQQNIQYRSTDDLLSKLDAYRKIMDGQGKAKSAIFCVAETARQIYDVARANRIATMDDEFWSLLHDSDDPDDPANDEEWQMFKSNYRTYFATPGLCEEELDAIGPRSWKILQGHEGFSPYADPSTGFELSYEVRFGSKPGFEECKFYDALILAGFAACYVEHTGNGADNKSVNQAIIDIAMNSDGSELGGAVWNATSMEVYLNALEQGRLLHFIGASGEINFGKDTYTAATATTYVHWQILDGKIHHRNYFGGSGIRTADANASWLYLYNEQQAGADFDTQAEGGTAMNNYPALTDQYAVLVQGSSGFSNYRHQADVLGMYQMLRSGGFPDDHIILVLDKDMAMDKNNPNRGVVRNAEDGPDLFGGTDHLPAATVDYDSKDISPSDIANILLGKRSERLQTVLPQDSGTNVLLFWSGHGDSVFNGGTDEFCWRDEQPGNGFGSGLLKETVSTMTFRKLLICVEPCYGEAVIRPVEGIPGVLAISGASANEMSWADHWNADARLWMCDRFSLNLTEHLTQNPDGSFRDLFLYCAAHTLGSHAKIIGAATYGNLYLDGPGEFIRSLR
ncbi:MAG: peptidase C13 [Bacteroidales bacterium]|nr:peptidase C13 [Bacteroidales bacterium]